MKQATTLAAILAIAASMTLGTEAFAKDEKGTPSASSAAKKPATDEKAAADVASNAAKLEAAEKKEQQLDMAAAEEKKRKQAEQKEERRLAAIEKAKERKLKQAAWEQRCVIKTAMSDEEIALCREVRSKPAP
jgi:hypothetical protein